MKNTVEGWFLYEILRKQAIAEGAASPYLRRGFSGVEETETELRGKEDVEKCGSTQEIEQEQKQSVNRKLRKHPHRT